MRPFSDIRRGKGVNTEGERGGKIIMAAGVTIWWYHEKIIDREDRRKNMKIIAVMSPKGGIGKTTTAEIGRAHV